MRVGQSKENPRRGTSSSSAGRLPGLHEAWIGFGSNLGDRSANISRALAAFGDDLVRVSPIYETAPWGVLDQPWFLNGVARLHWKSDAAALLARCLEIEECLGRVRGERFGPRIIDLDVLVLGPEAVVEEGLQVPHPGIADRRSVLEPWADLCPDLLVPGTGLTLARLRASARSLPGQELRLSEAI
ncbi:MAG: 2-amino-4-hydroxy-6-hydroxymethyldihydropteridine diphosphokinase [Myxococcota bacterium]|nr:2-amino-4-hydroxy-6-hydroxymethyldihydropteridine diphosphokinase [Myxococcota bacterium]